MEEKKILLQCDYTQGCHENIMKALIETNLVQTNGYGFDEYCESAKKKIKERLKNDNVDIYFVITGTSTNQIVISSILRPYEGVLTVESGHINVHETGAIETTGHKVIVITKELKLTSQMIENYLIQQINDKLNIHVVQAKLVYLSLPTENGLLYSKNELEKIYEVCKKYNIYLFIDGARLSYGLSSIKNDIKFEDLPNLCDVFYIGGTKCGALFGEAIVISNNDIKKNFGFNIKLRGALLAKGRLLGIQFNELFNDDIYFKIGKNAVDLALYLKNELIKKGIQFYVDSYTNQQFPIITKEKYNEITQKFEVSKWSEDNEFVTIRVCTSWATTKEIIEQFLNMF